MSATVVIVDVAVCVLRSIELDGELELWTVEVEDVAPDRKLTPELAAVEPSCTKPLPDAIFRARRPMAHSPCVFAQSRTGVNHEPRVPRRLEMGGSSARIKRAKMLGIYSSWSGPLIRPSATFSPASSRGGEGSRLNARGNEGRVGFDEGRAGFRRRSSRFR